MYYWLLVRSANGRYWLHDVPFRTESRAERVLEDRFQGRGEVIPLPTADRVTAARQIRMLLAEGRAEGWGRNFRHVQ